RECGKQDVEGDDEPELDPRQQQCIHPEQALPSGTGAAVPSRSLCDFGGRRAFTRPLQSGPTAPPAPPWGPADAASTVAVHPVAGLRQRPRPGAARGPADAGAAAADPGPGDGRPG